MGIGYIDRYLLFFCQFAVHFHQFRHAFALFHFYVKPVCLHDRTVVFLMSLAQCGGHGNFIVEVSKGTVGIFGTGI